MSSSEREWVYYRDRPEWSDVAPLSQVVHQLLLFGTDWRSPGVPYQTFSLTLLKTKNFFIHLNSNNFKVLMF